MELSRINKLSELRLIKSWLAQDEIGKKELGEYLKIENWFSLLSQERRAFLIINNDQKLGFIDLEIVDKSKAYFSFYIIPEKRNSGLGTLAILNLIEACLELQINKLIAGVNINNLPSQKVFTKNKFHFIIQEKEYNYFEYKI